MNNKELYQKFYNQHIKEGGKLPDASALSLLIEHCIRNKKYTIYYDIKRDKNHTPLIDDYEVIVVFNFAGDPTFGLLREDDLEDVIVMGTDKGLRQKYI